MRVRARATGEFVHIPDDQRLVLDHLNLQGADFSRRELMWGFVPIESRFVQCRFERMKVQGMWFGAGKRPSEYLECSFDGCQLEFGAPGRARLERCSFRDVDLRDLYCHEVEFIDCTFTGRLRNGFFNGTVDSYDQHELGRERNEFRGNDFSAMELWDVAFRTGIDLTEQRLPTGPEYVYLPDAGPALQRARTAVERWEDSDARKRALVLIQTLDMEASGGQKQLLLRREPFIVVCGRDAVERVVDLLRGQ